MEIQLPSKVAFFFFYVKIVVFFLIQQNVRHYTEHICSFIVLEIMVNLANLQIDLNDYAFRFPLSQD